MTDIFGDEEESSGLTPEQEQKAINAWNSMKEPSLPSIGKEVFGPGFSITSQIGKKLKKFIASRNIKKLDAPALELTETQQIAVLQNVGRLSNPLDLAKFVFADREVLDGSPELAAVQKYVLNIKGSLVKGMPGKESISYKAPKKPEEVIGKVNAATFGKLTKDLIDKDSNVKTNLTALVRFLNSFRFGLMYQSLNSDIERELFETTFVKYTFDKPDLTEEEVDQYLNLTVDIVFCLRIEKELEYVMAMRDSAAEDSEGKKFSMSLVESMANLREERERNLKRQSQAITMLQGKRSSRIDTKIRENASILQIIGAWKQAEKRARMIKLAEEIKAKEKKELVRLDSIEAFKGELWGINPESYDYTPDASATVIEEKAE